MTGQSPAENYPTCPVFGECGGCAYHLISYAEELELKNKNLLQILQQENFTNTFSKIIPSPKIFHYRHRLDLALRRLKTGEILMGFVHPLKNRIVPVKQCPIALKPVSDFIPTLREEAILKLTPKYRLANLTVRTGEEGRIQWGGIGKKSLKREPNDYFWTTVGDKRIYYSLDTFFQANLSILPALQNELLALDLWNQNTVFLDLYGGVGLFSLMLIDKVKEAVLIEQNPASIQLAHYNKSYHAIENWRILEGPVEQQLSSIFSDLDRIVAMVDPPRKGLSADSCEKLAKSGLKTLLYLSCNPLSLVYDIKVFLKEGWKIEKMIPFDFFPRTPHLEVLTLLLR